MKQSKIVVVGSYNVDITAFTARFPKNGETVSGNSIRFGSGGKGFNQAVAAAKAGGEVIMVTAVGEDELSGRLFSHMDSVGMSSSYVVKKPDVPTGSALIEVSAEAGENRIIVIPGANALLSEADVSAAEEEIKSADVLLTQLETSYESTETALRLAKKHGVTTVLNPAPFCALSDEVLSLCDWFTPNETEASFYSGVEIQTVEDASLAARVLLEKGIKHVLITLGKKGCLYMDRNETLLQSAIEAKVVDTTGAGDSFNGALCVALSEGKEVEEALRFATCVSSITVSRKGAADAMPTRKEAMALYERYF